MQKKYEIITRDMVKLTEKISKKTGKTRIKPGSSHPYTQRQLVLERKLKTTCPQVRIFTPDTAKIRIHFSEKTGKCKLFTGSENQSFQSSSTYPSNRIDSEFTKRII